jgi:glucosamine-6-phosphate deaminase
MRRSLTLTILPDAAAVAERVADRILSLAASRARVTLGLATGDTMRPVYERLVAAAARGASFSGATCFNLDEYVGLAPDHPSAFAHFMHRHFFDHVDVPERARRFPPTAPAEDAGRYDAAIRQERGIDLQVLGVGRNGHIAFNEPGSSFGSRTRVVTLDPSTRAANASAFGGEEAVPRQAVTVGIATILDAREILAVATGRAKAGALRDALEGPVTPDCPASALRLHPNASILCDLDAACLLQGADAARAQDDPTGWRRCAIS